MIADSNFRNAVHLPRNWDVHVYPGMKLEHAIKIVGLINNQPHQQLQQVIVSVGINNRSSAHRNNNSELSKLYSALTKGQYKGFYLGVSIPSTLYAGEAEILRNLNSAASIKFLTGFIAPLATNQVSVSPSDTTGIHYDNETLKKICDKLTAHFLRVNQKKPSKC